MTSSVGMIIPFHSQLFLESQSKFHGSSHHQPPKNPMENPQKCWKKRGFRPPRPHRRSPAPRPGTRRGTGNVSRQRPGSKWLNSMLHGCSFFYPLGSEAWFSCISKATKLGDFLGCFLMLVPICPWSSSVDILTKLWDWR